MTVEYLPQGVKCNLSCTYCYQEPMRKAGNYSAPLNFHKVKETIVKANSGFSLFGGEPLLASMDHLREVFEFGDSINNANGVQTNGLLITPEHIELFKKHSVHVGVSIDGPGLCNSARSSGADTDRIISNIQTLLAEKISCSLIITIHALNYLHFSDLLDFVDDMVTRGIESINFHDLEVDSRETRRILKLSDDKNFEIFANLYINTDRYKIHINPFGDIKRLLTQVGARSSCIWNNCDPITTPAVHGIDAEGSLTNCGRTNKSGINYLKGTGYALERYVALALTEQADGGCKDCKYFFLCKGNCPGTAIDGDWRNRTEDCRFWYQLIDFIANDLRLSKRYELLDTDRANAEFMNHILKPENNNPTHYDVPHGDSHGDHWDSTSRTKARTESTGGIRQDKLDIGTKSGAI